MEEFEYKYKGQMDEVADRIDGMAVFARGRWFSSWMECLDFS